MPDTISQSPALKLTTTSPSALSRYKHPMGMLLITAILAACFTSIKAGLDFAPPLLFGSLRALIGGVALLGFVRLGNGPVVPARSTWPWVLSLALIATTFTYAAMFLSPGRTEAGIASALGNLQPFMTLVLAVFFLGETLTRGKAAVVALGFAGVILISHPTFMGSGALGISGAVLALTVSGSSSVANVFVKRLQLGTSLLAVTAWQFLIGGAMLLLLSALVEDWARLDPNLEFAAILFFLGLLGTAFTTGVWFSFVQEGDVGRLATFFYLVPVFGLAFATLAFDEPLTFSASLGIPLILLAVGVMAVQKQDSPG